MAKFSFKSEYITTPIKLILPGIIVATAGYFLFNNPAKKKARETYQNWKVIKEYEDAFFRGNEDAVCQSDTLDQLKFRKDYSHLLEILINNLSDLKKDNNVDKRLDAFLNIKIARYREAKRLTEAYLDTVLILNDAALRNPYDNSIKEIATDKFSSYVNELAHVESRDTAELKRIADRLNKEHLNYTDSFIVNNNPLQPLDQLNKNYLGKWWFPELQVAVEFKPGNKGIWEVKGQRIEFNWTKKDYQMTLEFADETDHFFFIKANQYIISVFWKEQSLATVGCRKEPNKLLDLLKKKD